MGAFWLPVSMNVAKLVMSSANPARPSPNSATILRPSRISITRSSSSPRRSIASQNRRWSNAGRSRLTHRRPAVVSHQSAKARFEQGSTIRFAHANAR
jgi:hypothetical protein